ALFAYIGENIGAWFGASVGVASAGALLIEAFDMFHGDHQQPQPYLSSPLQCADVGSNSIRQPDFWDQVGPYAVQAAHVVDDVALVAGVGQIAKIGGQAIFRAVAGKAVALEARAGAAAVQGTKKVVGAEFKSITSKALASPWPPNRGF